MKLTVDPKALADAVAWAARGLPARPSVPVLAGLLLDATETGLTLSAFDYNTSRRVDVAADTAEPGRILLPGHVLAEVTKSLPSQPIEMALSGTEVVVTCGRAEFRLLTMPVDDYPRLPTAPDAVGTIDAHALAAAVAQVVVATSGDDTLPMLTGMRVDIDGDTVTFAATDRYRIAAREFTWEPAEQGVTAEVVIPGRALHDIAKGIPAGPVTIGLGDGLASFTGGGRVTTLRLLDDDFINYQARLGLADYPTWAEFDVAPLTAAIKRVALVGDRNGPVRLAFTAGEVLVQAGGGDMGRASESMPAELDGADIEIAFQPGWLLDALAGVDAPRARLGMTSPAKPALTVPAGSGDNPDYRHLLMALRLP